MDDLRPKKNPAAVAMGKLSASKSKKTRKDYREMANKRWALEAKSKVHKTRRRG